MKVYAIIGKDPNSDETYLAGVFSDEKKAIAPKNYLNCSFKSDYYIEEREI